MLSAHLHRLHRSLTKLRYCPVSERAFQLGFVSGLLSGYLGADLIEFDVYERLTALKLNAWEHCLRDSQGDGA
ncbi:hypothetical protein AOX63_08450 [Pseudomonas sp. ADP]|nr:hypothetical protein AOX63_08450 [Pseudomonas sp. ADP]